jgi:thymidylate synthase (FAD)
MQVFNSPRTTALKKEIFLNPDHFPYKPSGTHSEDLVEFSARLCYLSFGAGQIDGHKTVTGRLSRVDYFNNLKEQKHGSVMEHSTYTVLIEGVSRSLTHELVRHRAGFAYSQLSQRFVEAQNVGFVRPLAIEKDTPEHEAWYSQCEKAELAYQTIIKQLEMKFRGKKIPLKAAKEAARSVLPNCAETKIVVTANMRAWRHFLTKRGAVGAEPEIRRLAMHMLIGLQSTAPILFDDLNEARNEEGIRYIKVEYEGV